MSELVVRVYNVRFGDAILITIPEPSGATTIDRNILIDCGNALGTDGGRDAVLLPVVEDIKTRLGGHPLDLYVMTHEHLDHVQGMFYASEATHQKPFDVRQVWLSASADPAYGTKFPNAKKQQVAALAAYRSARASLAGTANLSGALGAMLANNNPSSTAQCVSYLRTGLAQPADVHFVDRETDLSTLQPATSARISLWAPEQDTSTYYGRFQSLASGLQLGVDTSYDDLGPDPDAVDPLDLPQPPRGVDTGAFYNLLDVRHGGGPATLFEIDKAANNTSVVLFLEWNGWKLLFPGDAEKRSWREMDKRNLVEPVHFLKISHHGSHTGLPEDPILDKLLPMPAPAGPTRQAAVSTYLDTYPGVPDQPTLDELGTRTVVRSTLPLADADVLEYRFPSTGPAGGP
jgi:hypothetical protein